MKNGRGILGRSPFGSLPVKQNPLSATFGALANRHLALHAHHLALGAHHAKLGQMQISGLDTSIARHNLGISKLFNGLAGAPKGPLITPQQALDSGGPTANLAATPAPPDGILPQDGLPIG